MGKKRRTTKNLEGSASTTLQKEKAGNYSSDGIRAKPLENRFCSVRSAKKFGDQSTSLKKDNVKR